MERKIFVVGGRKLRGEVRVSGAKNSSLPIMAATILGEGISRLRRIPRVTDTLTMARLLHILGLKVNEGEEFWEIDGEKLSHFRAPYELVKTMRASILVLGPLIARLGRAEVSLPGGCAIGARPVDLHLKGLERMGAEITIEHGYIMARSKGLRGARIYLDKPTVTGTENLLMAATLAKGNTVIENAAQEPEVEDLARFLKKMGAEIEGEGTDTITVRGVDGLRGAEHEIIPDRIEAGTLMVAAAITQGEVKIVGCVPRHLDAVVEKLLLCGAEVDEESSDVITIRGPEEVSPVDIETMPFPGFPTDLQAQFMALLAVANGTSIIKENVFENRFMHVSELRRMGAHIALEGRTAVVKGVERLTGAEVMASDLRASASLIIAGLRAEGETVVSRIYHLDRGYERLDEKLRLLGAEIGRR